MYKVKDVACQVICTYHTQNVQRNWTGNDLILGIKYITFSFLRNYLLSSSEDGTVRLWSLQTFTCLVGYKGHNYPVWDTQFSPYGYYFVSGGHDRVAR